MSLNCLTCNQALQRTNSALSSDGGFVNIPKDKRVHTLKVERNWSGPISPSPHSEMMRADKKGHHRRLNSTGAVFDNSSGEPKLRRSGAMRRDWSFEDLRVRSLERKGEMAC
ncbi:hypothetical protein ACFE04_014688 [Oxalis oulophora]